MSEGGGVCSTEGEEQRKMEELQAENSAPNQGFKTLHSDQFQSEEGEEGEDADADEGDADADEEAEDDSGTDVLSSDEKPSTHLQRAEAFGSGRLPHVFQTSHLLFYERFKAYQDYMLGDCKPSEVRNFTADYLEKVLEPCDWQALWHTEVFDVLIEVVDVDWKDLRAKVELVLPLQCETRGCDITEESMRSLLEATLSKVQLQELHVVFDESGDFDQTALALEHLRFFYKHIWRKWDEEDEDDEFDYFVRCVEPRLRLFYDIAEDRVPAGLVEEYHSLLDQCSQTFREFSRLRNVLSSDSESELDNVSMVEGLRLYEQMEALKRKLRIIENPLLRYVLGYRMNCGQQSCSAKGQRPGGGRLVHVVSQCSSVQLLHGLMTEKLLPLYSGKEFEIQFHSDPSETVSSCYEGDVVIVCPGHYIVTNSISVADSIQIEGYGLPDEIVIEKRNKGDSFVESTAADVKISNLKFIQHDAIEGIMCVRQGKLEMENCVLQCETTGVIIRTSAHLVMNMCDLYGSKGAGVEIYPGSVCSLVGNGIHHCKEGILIKDFADALDVLPQISMVNNVIHNNEGYGVILVKPNSHNMDAEGELEEESKEGGATVEEGGATGKAGATEAEGGATENEGAETPSQGRSTETVGGAVSLEAESDGEALAVDEACSVPADFTEGNDELRRELLSSKRRLQKNRARNLGSMRADENLLSREMFVSIHGNQFRRNGKGSFGTFLY